MILAAVTAVFSPNRSVAVSTTSIPTTFLKDNDLIKSKIKSKGEIKIRISSVINHPYSPHCWKQNQTSYKSSKDNYALPYFHK